MGLSVLTYGGTFRHSKSWPQTQIAIPPRIVIMTVKHYPSHTAFVDISDFIGKYRDLGFIFTISCP